MSLPPSKRIRLLLVDDHSVVRMGLAALLGLDPAFEVVAEAEDGEEALRLYPEIKPDVILMDVRMPGLGGAGAVHQLRKDWPDACVLMLTTSELEEDIHRALQAGAKGYLLKTATRDELTGAILRVYQGKTCIPDPIASHLEEHAKRSHLSQREIEVLDHLRKGHSNRDISVALGISEHTAKAHVKSILRKLESADRTEAVARGFEQGLLTIEGG